MKKYMIYNKPGDFNALGQEHNIDPVIAKLMINRDVPVADFDNYLHPSLDQLNDPHLLTDMDQAVDLIMDSIKQNHKIRVIGDYDIDGVNSTYILVSGLRNIGAQVDYAIPDRIEDGYGINPQIVNKALADGIDCIITCDNGVSALEAFQHTRQAGIRTIITDHHEMMFNETDGVKKEILPDVDALINPHRAGDNYLFSGICGAVVAFKLVQCLYEAAGLEEDKIYELIQFAAFATVGDVMELVDENRAIVKLGLEAMNSYSNSNTGSACFNYGVAALKEACQLKKPVDSYALGFILGPCVNASGRLDSAKHAVELLLAQDRASATALADKLVRLNEDRKTMTMEATKLAIDMANAEYASDRVLVIYIPDIHESICGIVAGRVREACDKPAIVLTNGESAIKGSARSIEAYNMYEKLHECNDLFSAFGGHPMAAGLSLAGDESQVEVLRTRLNEACGLTDEDLVSKEYIDVAMPLDYISFSLIDQLSLLEPFGNGNKKPCFALKNVKVASARYIGKTTQFIKFELLTSRGKMDALCFKDHELVREKIISQFGQQAFDDMMGKRPNPVELDIIYYPQINEFNGFKSLQIVINELL